MGSGRNCGECRWWTQDWKGLDQREGACMIARTEPDDDGRCRPVVERSRMRAVGNGGGVSASLFTRIDFTCADFSPRTGARR
jgi:hypothetical protein